LPRLCCLWRCLRGTGCLLSLGNRHDQKHTTQRSGT
jgi:hypothetical protein